MTRFDDLDRALVAYFDGETIAPAPDGLLDAVLDGTARRRPQRAWRIGLAPGWSGLDDPTRRRALGRPGSRGRWLFAGVLLLLTATVALAVGVGSRVTPRPTQAIPTSLLPSPSPVSEFPAQLAGQWVADQPVSMSFGMPSGPTEMSLTVGASTVFLSDRRKIGWLSADATATLGVVRFVSRIDDSDASLGRNLPTDGVVVADPLASAGPTFVPACRAGDVGTYGWSVGPDPSGTLILSATSDDCLSRRGIFDNRVWQRSVAGSISGPQTVDAFAPSFTVTLPAKDYDITRTNASYGATSLDSNVRFSAFQDPRAIRDVCDARGGRVETGRDAEAFIAALGGQTEFTVERRPDRTIGGLPATVITLRTRASDRCPQATLQAWQPAAETSGKVWSYDPGWETDLVLVDVGTHTVMFEVDIASPPEEPVDQILDSIAFQP